MTMLSRSLNTLDTKKPSGRIAVIDIGSNSVRLVVYDALKRVPIPIFNERVMCALARGLGESGRLNRSGVALTNQALSRFVAICKALNVQYLDVLATAAVRDAEDSKLFVDDIRFTHNINVHVITGHEEARFAALGIIASLNHVDGVVFDLGGGSLEMANIEQGIVKECASFPIGLLRLNALCGNNIKQLTELIDRHINNHAVIRTLKGRHCYLVGGGFRALAKMHIAKTDYPLRIVHNYILSSGRFHRMVANVAKMNEKTLANYPGVSSKRIEAMPTTAIVAERILTHGAPHYVEFSAYGIREGFLYDALLRNGKIEDPLISASEHLMTWNIDNPAYEYEVFVWLTPLFANNPNTSANGIGLTPVSPITQQTASDWLGSTTGILPPETASLARLRKAACILSQISRLEHNEYRAEFAFRRIMDAHFVGITHQERVMLALTLFFRYESNEDMDLLRQPITLLDKQQLHYSKALGFALRLGHSICAGAPGILSATHLYNTSQMLILEIEKSYKDHMGDMVKKRLTNLSRQLDLSPMIKISE